MSAERPFCGSSGLGTGPLWASYSLGFSGTSRGTSTAGRTWLVTIVCCLAGGRGGRGGGGAVLVMGACHGPLTIWLLTFYL